MRTAASRKRRKSPAIESAGLQDSLEMAILARKIAAELGAIASMLEQEPWKLPSEDPLRPQMEQYARKQFQLIQRLWRTIQGVHQQATVVRKDLLEAVEHARLLPDDLELDRHVDFAIAYFRNTHPRLAPRLRPDRVARLLRTLGKPGAPAGGGRGFWATFSDVIKELTGENIRPKTLQRELRRSS